MGRTYDLTNVEESQWINEAGEFTVKVKSVHPDYTANNNVVEKVIMETKDALMISDEFVVTDKALWRMKQFTKALKLPTVNDTDQWVGRYVKITVIKEPYTKNDGTKGNKFVVSKYHPSNLTNTIDKEEPNPSQLPDIEISDEQIPF